MTAMELQRPRLSFDDLHVGMTFTTAGRTVTEADLVAFAGIAGDFNPLHTDAEFAKQTIFGQRVAHGTLVLALATGLRQRTGLFEGTMMAFLEIRRWAFRKPVCIGDTLHVVTEITGLRPTRHPDRGIMEQAVRVLNQRGEVVAEGEFVNMVRRRGAG
jgi:acyl dehydratase